MEAYYDASLTASILLQEVMKEMRIKVNPGECCKNGLDKKIFKKCKSVIEKEYSDKDYQDLLKLYISSYFIDESLDNSEVVFEDYDENMLEDEFEDYFDESINLAS
ncbi:MAG: hypothetical protein KDC88_10760 [Ignavibacteriae bacterium]|nr:hypothetical protein [Ignavibacteriota bacterium]MCB9209774.1 hypothetical protein [Ignavibacteriales bacterium]MCB9218930.1 hypothetical protein [Ignavibacteriales bacterium]